MLMSSPIEIVVTFLVVVAGVLALWFIRSSTDREDPSSDRLSDETQKRLERMRKRDAEALHHR